MGCTSSKTEPTNKAPQALPSLLTSSRKLHLKLSSLEPSERPDERSSTRAGSSSSTVSSVSWEAELWRVTSDLEKKLQDPHFVAKSCDLDGSGDLDQHELCHAARCFGLRFSAAQLQRLMGKAGRISKERFGEIVKEATSGVSRCPAEVPHSLRGIALGQLQHLEALFVQSGWLSAQCDAYNTQHADAIRQRQVGVFHQSTNLYALDAYVVSPMTQPGSCAAREHDRARSIPAAKGKTSFSSLLNPHGLIVHCFVSHFWGKLFSETVTALQLWAERFHLGDQISSPKSVVFWICLFAVNQHAVADEVGESPMQGPFNAAIAKAKGGAVMVLDEQINPFKRIWCLFEVSRLKELHQPFELICDLGSLSRPETLEGALRADPHSVERILKATCEALWTVSAINAKASVKKDKVHIWQEIANSGSRKALQGMETLLLTSDELPDESQFWLTDFDRYIQSLLSTALLQFFLAHRHEKAAARCCAHGALFTQDQFQQIFNELTDEEKSVWLSQLLNVNAQDARLDTVKFLLHLGADPEMIHHGRTALMHAATAGQHAVTQVLLEHNADVAAADSGGTTALMRAALGGHVPVAKLLLEHGADVAAAEHDGTTALMHSALAGHESMVKLLLDHGSHVRRREKDGTTALMGAALAGHVAVARLLLQHGADIEAALDDGMTPLISAALDGHAAMVQLLLESAADVTAATGTGRTALSFAAEGGHEEVAKLLLDHGANLEVVDSNGITAMSYASRKGHGGMERLLKEYDAKTSTPTASTLESLSTFFDCRAKVPFA